MNSENYIVLNGKKTELTDEQLKLLGIERPSNPFERVDKSERYYFVMSNDDVDYTVDDCNRIDKKYFDNANYFNNKNFATQVMLHQKLWRKLLKYAYEHKVNVPDDAWDEDSFKYFVAYDKDHNECVIEFGSSRPALGIVYFKNKYVVEYAIRDVVEPFMKEHPEFVW